MPRRIRRTRPLLTPIVLNRTTKAFVGFSLMTDDEDNTALTAHWLTPFADGTIKRTSAVVDAGAIRTMAGFDAIVDAIVAASE